MLIFMVLVLAFISEIFFREPTFSVLTYIFLIAYQSKEILYKYIAFLENKN